MSHALHSQGLKDTPGTHREAISRLRANRKMDDVCRIIAARVTGEIDNRAWSIDDVAGAAACLAMMGNPFTTAISRALWSEVQDALESASLYGLAQAAGIGKGRGKLGFTLAEFRPLARAIRVKATTSGKTQAEECVDSKVGRHCPITHSVACSVLAMSRARINSSSAAARYGVGRLHFLRAGCMRYGVKYGKGFQYRLRDVREVVRRSMG